MGRIRSLRWRLTFLYLALLAVLLLAAGTAQYFAAREVLFRSNADVLDSEYNAVFSGFRKQNASRPPAAWRALIMSQAFSDELRSRRTSAAMVGPNGGLIVSSLATLATSPDVPALTFQEYRTAAQSKPKPYYIASAADGATSLVVLNVIRNGAKAIALAQLSIATDDIDRTLSLDRDVAVIGSLSVLLLALLLSPLIIGRALRPLKQMSVSAGKLAAGDYKQRVTVPRASDEIGTLAVAFNQMAAGIDQAFEVRRQSEEQMRHFVADASHELRTPLTSIAGYIDVLGRREVVDPETLQTSLAALQQDSARMTRLVNDLLTLTRFESGKAPSRQPLQLDQFVNQALDELSLRDNGAVESRDFQPGVTVKADPEALKQVVTNLAQNALKYAPGAEQHWSVFTVDGRAAIRLHDDGPGISRQDLPHIFERFYRGEKARDRSTGGSGLGLSIARSFVEAHQGTIDAVSEPGQGATFTAWLPLAA